MMPAHVRGQWLLVSFLMFMTWRSCRAYGVPETINSHRHGGPSKRPGYASVSDASYEEDEPDYRPAFRATNRRRFASSNPDFYFPEDLYGDEVEGVDPPAYKAPRTQDAFSYDEKAKNGPSNWFRVASQCGGRYQSPIMLNTSEALVVKRKRPLRLVGHTNLPRAIVLQNDGHSAKFTYSWADDARPVLRGGPLKTKYLFEQFHFHWGADNSSGSEHVHDQQRYPMEIHLVFYNGMYDSFEQAREEVDGIVVVGMFYEIARSALYEPVNTWTEFLRQVSEPSTEFNIPFVDTFPLYDITGDFEWPYFSYEGSLTTPPCLETVTWIVSTKPLTVTEKELNDFRRLRTVSGSMVNNFRPVQKLNNRRVFLY